MSDFKPFAEAVSARFAGLAAAGELFTVAATGDELWDAYLAAFPPGADPHFRERTAHDCSTCREFVKRAGGVVSIDGGELRPVWDVDPAGLDPAYAAVSGEMAAFVRAREIDSVFRTAESRCGAAETTSPREGGGYERWSHFHADVPRRFRTAEPAAERGAARTNAATLRRALGELSVDACDTVLDLIGAGTLYRGEQFRGAVEGFRALSALHETAGDKTLFVWRHANAAAGFRNTAVGTLVTDLSAGVPVEEAVGKFEAKVAPENYRRPAPVVTPRMVAAAAETVEGLGLGSALARRFARPADVAVSDVLFVDNAVRGELRGGDAVTELLGDVAAPPPALDISRAREITEAEFLTDVLPGARELRVLVEGRHAGNFVALTAPAEPGAGRLFAWDNDFAWGYAGGAADSVKKRVKRAGGAVDADLRVSLAWENTDDLDLHGLTPAGERIFYGNKRGVLDVDMNVSRDDAVRGAVENMAWFRRPLRSGWREDASRLADGVYRISVKNFCRRESVAVGFSVEVECDGAVTTFSHAAALGDSRVAQVCDLTVRGGRLVSAEPASKAVSVGAPSREIWGVRTGAPARVTLATLSPNHWGDAGGAGHRHLLFALEGCECPEPLRGVFNEFLRPELHEHRRAFELLGGRTKCPPAADQVAGVGFTAARGDDVVVHVTPRPGSPGGAFRVKF